MDDLKCRECQYFKDTPERVYTGICKRYPPFGPHRVTEYHLNEYEAYPAVDPSWSACGEFRPSWRG